MRRVLRTGVMCLALVLATLVVSGEEILVSGGPVKVGEEVSFAYRSPAVAVQSFVKGQPQWQIRIEDTRGTYICPHFSHFSLPDGAVAVVRSEDGSRSWTYSGQGKGDLGTSGEGFWGIHIPGQVAIVEIFSPVPLSEGAVVIDRYARGFRQGGLQDLRAADTEAICGTDDSRWAPCYESSEPTIYSEARAVARLLINGSSACTGWLVGDQGHLMTNEHCIGSSSAAANTDYEFMAEGSNCSTSCASWFACSGTVVATSATLIQLDSALDYALVKLPTNPTGTYGYMQLRDSAPSVNERIYIPQHPAGYGKKIAVESSASSDQSGYCEVYSTNQPPCSGGPGDIGYYADTQGGSSGSPVLGYSDHCVVALHHCANCPNRGVPIDAIISDLGSNVPPNAMCGGTNESPTVDITSPANGSSFEQGQSVSFAGTASDPEDGNLTSQLGWTSNLDGTIGTGGSFSTSSLSVGNHTITASVTDSGGATGSDSIQISISSGPSTCPAGSVDFNALTLTDYSNQNVTDNKVVEDGGDSLRLTGNTWVRSTSTFSITANTVIDFEFASDSEGEIHAIGFDNNDTLNDNPRHFMFWGTQNWTGTGKIEWTPEYNGSGSLQSFSIPVGDYYTGNMWMVFTNDKDSGTLNNESLFKCVRVYETDPPACDVDESFESGAGGWTNSGSSTCTTGTFVVGTPTEVVNGGVTTQVGGAYDGSNAWFTATNSSAGVNDVDGGVCITESPVYNVTASSDVTAWFFHGQRDAGDDASGDFFRLEVSINGGAWTPLAEYGDVTVNAAWTQASTTAQAGDTVQFRVQASDGSGPGDLVEAGIDAVSICSN